MKFSITYPLIAHPYHPEFLEKANVIRFARAAEAAGFDALGFTDHPAPSQKWLDGGGHARRSWGVVGSFAREVITSR